MQDTEFTVEEGSLYMLQTRNAKRPAQAGVRFAVDAVEEGLLDKRGAIATIDAAKLDALLHPGFKRDADFNVLAEGVAASPGAAKGAIVFTADDAVQAAEDGRDVILVRPFTEADDVAGFHAAKGILTSEGGKASHAALVARGMGRPAVVGADGLDIDLKAGVISVNGHQIHAGDRRWSRPRSTTTSRPCSAGRTRSARWTCAPTPTIRPARSRRASSAPRASACAAPSTCSWPRTASPRCGR
jgi:pyruvate,orthophosphate dikinase